jgi:hypothetical protein
MKDIIQQLEAKRELARLGGGPLKSGICLLSIAVMTSGWLIKPCQAMALLLATA